MVIGGTAGIGKALALGLAEAGADVVACGRTAATVEETAAAIVVNAIAPGVFRTALNARSLGSAA